MILQGWKLDRILRMADSGAGTGGGEGGGEGGGQQGGGAGNDGIMGGQQGGQGGGQQGGGGPQAILDQMSAEMRTGLASKDWKTADDIGKAYLALEAKIGEQGVRIPKPDAGEERWNEFYTAMGRPESADKYELPKPPEGLAVNEGREKWFREAAFKRGLSNETASALYADFYQNELAGRQELKAAVDNTLQALKAKHGEAWPAVLSDANLAFEKGFGAEGMEALKGLMTADGYPFTGHPLVVEGFAAIGKMLAEGSGGPGNVYGPAGNLILNAADAKRELARMDADDDLKKAFLDNKHPQHKEVMEKRTRLNTIIRGEGQVQR